MDFNNLMLSIDWLQLNCQGVFFKSSKYKYKHLNISTGVFKNVYEVSINDLLICTVARDPFSPIIKPDTNIIKFDNRLLYFDDLFQFIDTFISDHMLKIKGITRLDLAIDFNHFKNNLKPENLILNFLKNDYLRVNKGKYKLVGEQFKEQVFEYLRFGTNSSDVSVYLYNKSVEMKQKKFKQYIYNKWLFQNLDVTKDVWRLEFSIKTNNMQFSELDTGVIHEYSYNTIKNECSLNDLYKSLIYDYFRFKIKDNTVNKSRMKDVILFDNIKPTYNISFVTKHVDFTRMDKIFLKMIEKFNNNLRSEKKDIADGLKDEIISYAKSRRLDDWYNLNVSAITQPDINIPEMLKRCGNEGRKKAKIKAYQNSVYKQEVFDS